LLNDYSDLSLLELSDYAAVVSGMQAFDEFCEITAPSNAW